MTTSGSPTDTGIASAGSSTRSAGATQPAAGGRSHVVARGETLWSIAARYYGDGSQWKRIADANRMTDANRLYVGQTLTIP
jgi:5'-nucleotidase